MFRHGWMVPLLMGALAAQGQSPVSPKVLERYEQMLEKNPGEGTALDRLWSATSESGKTGPLIDKYRALSADAQAPAARRFTAGLVLGQLLRKAGRPGEAAAAFEGAAGQDGASPLPWLALGRLRLEEGKLAEASAAFEKGTALLPAEDARRLESLLLLGTAWLAAGDVEKASAAWERTIALEPANLELRRRLAESYLQHNLPERALSHFEYLKAHAAPAERAEALQALARIHQGAGRPDQAIAALEEAMAGVAPGSWLRGELAAQLIRLYQRYNRADELEARWQKAVDENPRDAAALLRMVDFYERLGDLSLQRSALEKLTALVPKNAAYRLRLARLLVRVDDLAGAAALYDALLKEQPASVDLVFERARIDVQREAMPAARARITAFLETRKNDESLRQKALEFFSEQRLPDLTEGQLKADAAGGTEEAVIALANFYFHQKRDGEARQALERLLPKAEPGGGGNPARQAAAKVRVAQVLKDQNEPEAAIAALQEALALEPASRERLLMLGEYQSGAGRYGEARAAFEKAFELSGTPAEKLEADQKLFESIRASSPVVRREESMRTRRGVPAGRAGEPGLNSAALQDYVLKLTRAAASAPSVEGWLRVARWQWWNRSPRVARECAQQALTLAPDSIEAHEFMVRLASGEPQSPVAMEHLEALMKIDAAGRAGYQRRAAQLHLQGGALEEALLIFSELAAANPGSLEALTDLGLAQQRGERWNEALETWQKVYALAPASRKKEAGAALLRIFERLNRHAEAAALLLRQVDAQTDVKEKFAGFQELLAYCESHQLLDWLRTEFEGRRKVRADDYFTGMALGRVLKAKGEKAAAFDVFADASLSAPNPAEALPELVREAEDLRKIDAAAQLQSRLVRILPQTKPEALEKLAQLQEKNLDTEDAARTWTKAVTRFPRDPSVLQHAIDFELKWGTPTRTLALLRRSRSLEPGNLRVLSLLAEFSLDAGAVDEAQSCLEEFLVYSAPEKAGDPIRYPALKTPEPGRVQNAYLSTVRMRRGQPIPEALRALRSFWVEEGAASKNESDLRLGAIRDLARIAQMKAPDAEGPAQWVARWRKTALERPSETLWALYYADAGGPLLDELEALMARLPEETQARQAFVWFALETGQFDRLAAWLHQPERTTVDRDFLSVSLGEYLGSGGMGGGGTAGRAVPGGVPAGGAPAAGRELAFLEKLFSDGYQMRRWQAAMIFAGRGRFAEAVQLGEPVFTGLSSQRPAYGLELSEWQIYLGDTEAAREVLGKSIGLPGDSFEAPVYHGVRRLYLLLPAAQRARFAEGFLSRINAATQPLHAALSGVLLQGLAGNERAARAQVLKLLELRPVDHVADPESEDTAPARFWSFVLSAGAQLQQFQMDELAAYLWENALADQALVRLQTSAPQTEQIRARILEMRTRLAAIRIVRAGVFGNIDPILEGFVAQAGEEPLVSLAETLESMGAYRRSLALYRQLWEKEPANPHALRNLLTACRTCKDSDTLIHVLERCVTENLYRVNDASHRDLILQWVEALEARGDIARARQILEQGASVVSEDGRLLLRLAQLDEYHGRPVQAEASYRRLMGREPGNVVARLALVSLLENQGRIPQAIALLGKTIGVEAEAKLAALLFKAGRFEEAYAALERLPATHQLPAALLFSERLVEKGDVRAARGVLRNALTRLGDGRGGGFPLEAKFIELLAPDSDRAMVAFEFRRLRRLTGNAPELLGGYFDFVRVQAARLGWEEEFKAGLREDWQEGEGTLFAGAALLESALLQGEEAVAGPLWERLLLRADLSEPVLQRLLAAFRKAGQPGMAADALGRLARIAPLDPARLVEWARALALEVGGPDNQRAALEILEKGTARLVLNTDIGGLIGQTYLDMGRPDLARPLFENLIAADPVARNFRAYLGLARIHREAGDYAVAKTLLMAAFRNPLNTEAAEIVDWFKAQGALERFESEIQAFGLDSQGLLQARRALFAEYEKTGAAEPALRLAGAFPAMADAALCGRLRRLCKGQPEKLAGLFEWMRAQPGGHAAAREELVEVHADWAEALLAAGDRTGALAQWSRAHSLAADHWGVAKRLSTLLLEDGQRESAARVLNELLAVSQNPAEKTEARALLLQTMPAQAP